MEYEEFSPLDNTLINPDYEEKTYMGTKPKIEKYYNKFPFKDDKGLVTHIEKVMVLKNGEWQYDTYLKSNKTIDKRAVKRYISNLENEYEIFDISYEFHGGPPMGTTMFNYREIEGDNIWVVNLRPKLFEYLKKKGHIGNLEDNYNQIGGVLGDEDKIGNFWNTLKLEAMNVNNIIIDTINNLFSIEENKKHLDSKIFKPVNQINTHFDGVSYYTHINVYKDGKYIDKMKVFSKNNPIEWKYIMNKILKINKDSKFYGHVYKLTNSINNGVILETTSDPRFKIDYKCEYT